MRAMGMAQARVPHQGGGWVKKASYNPSVRYLNLKNNQTSYDNVRDNTSKS
jgi:hypothetical protein